MATKRRRGNAFAYTIKRAALLPQPIYLSFDNEAEGDEAVRRIEALLDRGIVPDELKTSGEKSKRLRDAVGRYLDAQHVSDEDKRLLAVVVSRLPRDIALPELTFQWATGWVGKLKREQNLSPSTIRHHVGALARALDWLAAHGEIPMNPLRLMRKGYATYTPADVEAVRATVGDEAKVKEDNERDRRLEGGEEPEIRRILSGGKPEGRQRALALAHGEKLSLLFDTALESAMRMREMYTLSRSQVDLGRRTIFLEKTKNGDKRQVPISSVLGALLAPHLEGMAGDGLLFPWWDGDTSKRALERTTSRLSRQFARIFDAAGCDDLHFHDLRHEATSRLFERTTLSDMEIAKITGHKSLSMLRRYSNLRGSTLAERLW